MVPCYCMWSKERNRLRKVDKFGQLEGMEERVEAEEEEEEEEEDSECSSGSSNHTWSQFHGRGWRRAGGCGGRNRPAIWRH